MLPSPLSNNRNHHKHKRGSKPKRKARRRARACARRRPLGEREADESARARGRSRWPGQREDRGEGEEEEEDEEEKEAEEAGESRSRLSSRSPACDSQEEVARRERQLRARTRAGGTLELRDRPSRPALLLLLAGLAQAGPLVAAVDPDNDKAQESRLSQSDANQPASGQPADEEHTGEFKWALTFVYLVIFVIGVCGNLCNCLVIADSRNRYMKTATNYYLFSLSISDLLLLIFGLPHDLVDLWHPSPYLFNSFVCISRGWISEASTYASVLVIVAFTVERYLAICHPLKTHTMSRPSRAIKIIVAIWLVASSCALMVVRQFGIQTDLVEVRVPSNGLANATMPIKGTRAVAQCTIVELNESTFELSVLIFFIIPMTLITILYMRLGYHLRQKTFVIKKNRLDRERHLSQRATSSEQASAPTANGRQAPSSSMTSNGAGLELAHSHIASSSSAVYVSALNGAGKTMAPARRPPLGFTFGRSRRKQQVRIRVTSSRQQQTTGPPADRSCSSAGDASDWRDLSDKSDLEQPSGLKSMACCLWNARASQRRPSEPTAACTIKPELRAAGEKVETNEPLPIQLAATTVQIERHRKLAAHKLRPDSASLRQESQADNKQGGGRPAGRGDKQTEEKMLPADCDARGHSRVLAANCCFAKACPPPDSGPTQAGAPSRAPDEAVARIQSHSNEDPTSTAPLAEDRHRQGPRPTTASEICMYQRVSKKPAVGAGNEPTATGHNSSSARAYALSSPSVLVASAAASPSPSPVSRAPSAPSTPSSPSSSTAAALFVDLGANHRGAAGAANHEITASISAPLALMTAGDPATRSRPGAGQARTSQNLAPPESVGGGGRLKTKPPVARSCSAQSTHNFALNSTVNTSSMRSVIKMLGK